MYHLLNVRVNKAFNETKKHTVFYTVKCTHFYMENEAEIFPAHYTWEVAEKGFKMASIMN